ncbi:basic helix-loop-helix protein 004 [Ziziphus jujuba]|uniref:Basic helix-loop-helix protein 004 n=2 Tax=Ziziphus jujuba TaxID=326968 RepID=A0ABM3I9V7_ZIZJJ|nr:basic helix-loop-helix protein 004 [Ziziphus jujuba]KAH7542796.1 hypothetical protein FEM48_Zijuj02G0112900 [Ziziphus jujuba var. spinosa]
MVSREQKKSINKKLQLLRSITNSHARNRTSIILDASRYIQGLKQKVEKINEDIDVTAQRCYFTDQNPLFPVKLKVEDGQEGFVIKVLIERSCNGLLVFILEALEELGLDILQARVSCSDNFHLEAVGILMDNNQVSEHKDAQAVQQALVQAIQSWIGATQLN